MGFKEGSSLTKASKLSLRRNKSYNYNFLTGGVQMVGGYFGIGEQPQALGLGPKGGPCVFSNGPTHILLLGNTMKLIGPFLGIKRRANDLGLNDTRSEVEPNFKNPFDTIPKPFRYGPKKCVDIAFERMSFKKKSDPVWSMRKGDKYSKYAGD
ncbi:hypothetical protein Pyn_00392 [Prunus yedoensis var. nudiflora]|uniref:Uncharacterized protein n=1 Tax=Prunus yedoensis var. nudiflora TaxID=2094558 RepID=A0A314UW11_PRUYE|nr:hypothetical protein Pyn_00392 [Prunus yedoensis var. nudiflora]